MSSPLNTKLQAYLLIYDPTRLLSLLYSKYGDIEEDENLLYINQLLYNKSSQFNILFKEYQYNDLINEYLKRFYSFQESKNRIPKLNEYYKNYHQFFCKPIFSNFNISKIMHSFCDKKAEIFYRNNYMSLNEEEKSFSESSLSSLDNLTNNKIIFSKNTRFLIDNNENSSKCTLNLDSSRTLKSNLNLLTKRSKDDSFINNVNPIVNFNEDIETKKKANKLNKKMYPKTYRKKKLNLKNNIVEKEKTKEGNIKSSLYSLVKNNLNCKVMKNKKNVIASPKIKPFLSYYKSNIDELQSKVLDNQSNTSTEDENADGMDLSDHIDTLNSNIEAFKNIFNRKINNFKENFDQFISEFKSKDEAFTNLLNEKTQSFKDVINKHSENLSENVNKIFDEANKPTLNVKEQKIDWLNKQVDELSEYQKKGINYQNGIKDLTNENQILANKNKINADNLEFLKKNIVLKDESIQSIKDKKTLLEQKCNDIRTFILRNANQELKRKFTQAGF